ncbi:AHH domain-containing protein [Snodgrassella alvi]|uniref:AHH domain-containing protein n=1 Tax=Snodgrassella alvi TaxID=1196083 RepID=UPI000C1F0168|nr:AHH domain-containing protein [Snodgrassella alvi]
MWVNKENFLLQSCTILRDSYIKNGNWRKDVLNDPLNKIDVPGHKGPHPEEMHQEIYKRLKQASDKSPEAFKEALAELGKEAVTPNSWLNKILTKSD